MGFAQLSALLLVGAQAGTPFTIVFVPDTQFMVMDVGWMGGQQFQWIAQSEWIVEQKDALNIKAVMHLGDLVDHGCENMEWDNFLEGWDMIADANIPWQVVPGNHDLNTMDEPWEADRWRCYNERMTPAWEKNKALESSHPAGKYESTVLLFEGGGTKFIAIGLELGPSDETLAWASSKLEEYSDRHAIIVNHWMDFGGLRVTDWAREHRNVFMIHMGHECSREWNKVIQNEWGDDIQMILTDYQCSGDGYLRYYTFDLDNEIVQAETYSPALERFETDGNSQWTFPFRAVAEPTPAIPEIPPVTCDWNATLLEDVGLDGSPVGDEPSETAEGCCSICSEHSLCRGFSWVSGEGGVCHLLGGASLCLTNASGVLQTISGIMDDASTPCRAPTPIPANTCEFGEPLAKFAVTPTQAEEEGETLNEAGCKIKCLSDNDCACVQWSPADYTCDTLPASDCVVEDMADDTTGEFEVFMKMCAGPTPASSPSAAIPPSAASSPTPSSQKVPTMASPDTSADDTPAPGKTQGLVYAGVVVGVVLISVAGLLYWQKRKADAARYHQMDDARSLNA